MLILAVKPDARTHREAPSSAAAAVGAALLTRSSGFSRLDHRTVGDMQQPKSKGVCVKNKYYVWMSEILVILVLFCLVTPNRLFSICFFLKKKKTEKKPHNKIFAGRTRENSRVVVTTSDKTTEIVVTEYRSLSQERPGSAASSRNWNERRSASFLALCKPTRRNLVREGCRRALSTGASGPP